MNYYEICLQPLIELHPLYTGSPISLEPNTVGLGSIVPSTWTVAGTALNIISLHSGIDYEELIKLIQKRSLTLSGPYILDKHLWLNQSPREPRTILVPIQGIPSSSNNEESATPYFNVILSSRIPSKGLWFGLLKVASGEASLIAIMDLEARFVERIGIGLSSKTKTAREGMIYSYKALETIRALSHKYIITNILYCITVKSPIDIKNNSAKGIIDLGGKHGIAKYMIRKVDSDPFMHLDNLREPPKGLLLAISHIRLIKIRTNDNTMLVTPGCYKVESILGKITILYGWNYLTNTIKTPTLALTPGSLIKVASANKNINPTSCHINDEWYYKFLNTITILKV